MNAKEPIEGQYIVVLQPNISQEAKEKHMSTVRALHDVDETIAVRRIYDIGSFKAYSARMNRRLLDELREFPEVKYIEQDQVVHALGQRVCREEPTELWGLARISHRENNVNNVFNFDDQWDGQGVTAYVIDTGIYTEHADFEGRAEPGVSFVSDEPTSEDLNGHGTHVTGTIIGSQYGIARKATAVAVKVLSRYGSGSYEGVIDGINWVARNARKPAVSNMSLGGGFSQAVNDAVDEAVASGVMFAIAAGNGASNACFNSPASAKDGYIRTRLSGQ
jgi:subtilisin family serine protease